MNSKGHHGSKEWLQLISPSGRIYIIQCSNIVYVYVLCDSKLVDSYDTDGNSFICSISEVFVLAACGRTPVMSMEHSLLHELAFMNIHALIHILTAIQSRTCYIVE